MSQHGLGNKSHCHEHSLCTFVYLVSTHRGKSWKDRKLCRVQKRITVAHQGRAEPYTSMDSSADLTSTYGGIITTL